MCRSSFISYLLHNRWTVSDIQDLVTLLPIVSVRNHHIRHHIIAHSCSSTSTSTSPSLIRESTQHLHGFSNLFFRSTHPLSDSLVLAQRPVRIPRSQKQIHIDMPYSLFLCLKLLAKSRKEGVTEFVLDVFRECFGVEVVGQDPRPIKQPIIYVRRCHLLTEPDDSI